MESDLDELLKLRRSQGWRVTVRCAEASSPTLIAALVAEEQKRDPALSHVMLVGSDASLPMARQRNYRVQSGEGDLPVLTDDPYGLPDANGVPRLAIGRLPADDPTALRQLADKIVRYERNLAKLTPDLFLLCGRQPASTQTIVGGISRQTMADGMSAAFVEDQRLRLPRLKLRVRTAFPGPDYYPFADGPAVLRAGLAGRPFMAAYVGHADRSGFATYHDLEHVVSIGRDDVRRFEIPDVCGPFLSCGCSMLEPEGKGPSIGEVLLQLAGGPVAVVGFTRANNDFWVAQFLEVWGSELSRAGRATLGEMVRTTKLRLANAPQSPRSVLIQTLLQAAGEIPHDLQQIDHSAVARKNNALTVLLGDPTTTVVIP